MSWFSKKPPITAGSQRVVSYPSGSGRVYELQNLSVFGRWDYVVMAHDKEVADEWIENIKTNGSRFRVEYQQ